MKDKTKRLIDLLNFPKVFCRHLMGEEHTHWHHMAVGFVVMVLGVIVSKAGVLLDTHSIIIHYGGDVLGYGIHGIGLTPFIEFLSSEL